MSLQRASPEQATVTVREMGISRSISTSASGKLEKYQISKNKKQDERSHEGATGPF
jgi:hypothetical protein